MDERNVIGGFVMAIMSNLFDFMEPLKWFLLLGFILIMVDLRFGIMAAKTRGEVVRPSRAIRRTANKIIDYLCWILVAGAMGKAFGIPFDVPVLPSIVLLVVYGCEINSCYGNFFEAHGKKIKINIFKLFAKKVDIIEVEDDNK